MVDYPYDEKEAGLDKSTFDILARYFELRDDFKECSYGSYIFVYDEEKMKQLPASELMAISPYVLVYGEQAFDRGIRRGENVSRMLPDTKQLISLMRSRGITRESFLDEMMDFQFSAAGEESTQFIAMIASDLKEGGSFFESNHQGSWFSCCINQNRETSEKCAVENKGRDRPYSLEHVLKIPAKPVAIDYASNGRLYVFDERGMLHEFIEGLKSEEWQIRYGAGSFHRNEMDRIFSPIFPSISVEGNILFLTNGPKLERYDLVERKSYLREAVKYTGSNLALFGDEEVDPSDIWFHDVCLKEGNVFVSASVRTYVRTILQIDDAGKHHTIYNGDFPQGVGGSVTNFTDLTLRLGFFCGGLYFSEQNGISRLTSEGKAQEMLGEYTREINPRLGDIDPITKFAFGNDFLIASGRVKDFRMPMLQVFRPVYGASDGGTLVRQDEMVQPTHFERVYVGYIPRQTDRMIKELSISAHQDRFAMSHYDFERVFVYKMNSSKSR